MPYKSAPMQHTKLYRGILRRKDDAMKNQCLLQKTLNSPISDNISGRQMIAEKRVKISEIQIIPRINDKKSPTKIVGLKNVKAEVIILLS